MFNNKMLRRIFGFQAYVNDKSNLVHRNNFIPVVGTLYQIGVVSAIKLWD